MGARLLLQNQQRLGQVIITMFGNLNSMHMPLTLAWETVIIHIMFCVEPIISLLWTSKCSLVFPVHIICNKILLKTLLMVLSSVIRQKGESQNGCFKKTKHAKFSESLIDKFIKKDKIFNKQTCKGQDSLYINSD